MGSLWIVQKFIFQKEKKKQFELVFTPTRLAEKNKNDPFGFSFTEEKRSRNRAYMMDYKS